MTEYANVCGKCDRLLATWGKPTETDRRERIATAALQGLLSRFKGQAGDLYDVRVEDDQEWFAGTAVDLADALIAALDEVKA